MTSLKALDNRRRKLGMSRAALARRARLSLPTVNRVLTGHEDAPSVATLDAIACALGMAVQIVESMDADEMREQQATRKAKSLAGMVQATMALESQAVAKEDVDRQARSNINRLLSGSPRRLWEE